MELAPKRVNGISLGTRKIAKVNNGMHRKIACADQENFLGGGGGGDSLRSGVVPKISPMQKPIFWKIEGGTPSFKSDVLKIMCRYDLSYFLVRIRRSYINLCQKFDTPN